MDRMYFHEIRSSARLPLGSIPRGHSAILGPRAAPSYNAPARVLLAQCGRSGGPSDRFSPCGRRADAFGCPAAAWEAASPASIAIAAQARLQSRISTARRAAPGEDGKVRFQGPSARQQAVRIPLSTAHPS